MPKSVLALLLRTPVNLANNLLSDLGDADRTSSALALGVLDILVDVNLRSEQGGLDQEVTLESRVQECHSGCVGRKPDETKDRINRGVRKVDVERGVAGESVDGEFTTLKFPSTGSIEIGTAC